jgi:hypothetical protein
MALRLYDYRCPRCGKVTERLVRGNETVHSLCCAEIAERMPPVVRCHMGAAGAFGYYDETLGTYIRTNRHRREVMREQGVTEHGGTPKPDGGAWV